MAETRWTAEEARHRKDGIAIQDLHMSSLDEAGLELLRSWDTLEFVRQWGGGTGLEQMSQKALDAASTNDSSCSRSREIVFGEYSSL